MHPQKRRSLINRKCGDNMTSYRKFAYVYDELMRDMPYSEWLKFARTAWEKYGMPKTVVDLGCGTGSLSIPLANDGFQVTGIDLSGDMLSVAHRKTEMTSNGARLMREGGLRWVQQDMTAWKMPEPVDAVISFCDCLNYLLEEEDIVLTFRQTYAGLKEGGTFLFDVHHPNTLQRYAEEQPFIWDDDSVSYIWTCELDEDRMEIEHELTIFARDEESGADLYRRFEENHVQRAYDPRWMRQELLQVGFKSVTCYADFKWEEPHHDEAARLFFVAVK
ncbi:Glycine/sarcosine/dimethylglycine N-methyltransferase [compost metagenome]